MASKFEVIEKARRPEDLFGVFDKGSDPIDALKHAFRPMALQVHPDKNKNSKRSADAFAKLATLRDEAEKRIEAKIYGTSKPTPGATGPTIITRKKDSYIVGDEIATGDICVVRRGATAKKQDVVVKVAKVSEDNDLVENEAAVLRELFPEDAKEEKFYRYLPRLIDSFRLAQPGGPRQVNILPFFDGYHSLEAVIGAYPNGLAFEDVVWIYNRMLEGIGFVHQKWYVHGAIIPSHVMIHPEHHAAKFIDWSYAVRAGDKIKALSAKYEGFYPPEVMGKQKATAATDIYMIARCAKYLAGNTVLPGYFKQFIDSCLYAQPTKRPDSAWNLREEFDEVMKKNYGPRRYHKFTMP